MPQDTPRLPFEIDDTIDPTLVTGRAGVPLVIELFRQLGVAQTIDAEVAVKQRQRGLPPVAARRESHRALGERRGPLPGPHDAPRGSGLGHAARAPAARGDHRAGLPRGLPRRGRPPLGGRARRRRSRWSPPRWPGSGRANRTLVAGLQRGARERTATLDVDATLVESHKDAATVAYDGTRGYQPVVVLWAEQDVIVHDQFRDGHVPAGCGNVRVLEQAVANLPQGITQVCLRADSALYETAVLRWCEDEDTDRVRHQRRYVGATQGRDPPPPRDGLAGRARGARRDPRLGRGRRTSRRWRPPEGSALRPPLPRGAGPEAARAPLRRWEQRRTTSPWSRIGRRTASRSSSGTGQKAGTVEHAHHVLKNELAAAALPSGKFGANAAWFRLNVLTYNLLTALKRLTLPGDLRTARPKRLRFLLFNTVGKVVAHARRTLLRLSGALQHALLVRARRKIARLAPA